MPPPNTISKPTSKRVMIMGASHHFFLSFKKLKMSLIVSILVSLISENFHL